MDTSFLPTVNACLNTATSVLLFTGWRLVRRGRKAAHRVCMLSALGTSALFLASYLTYHYTHGTTRFGGTGVVRTIYFFILTTHTVLAVVIVPLVAITVVRALRERFDAHRRIARWTLPLWFYVSVTGVAVYLFLYRFYPVAG
jgi:uncharacterized membrane protein YozB (DUF420 family)